MVVFATQGGEPGEGREGVLSPGTDGETEVPRERSGQQSQGCQGPPHCGGPPARLGPRELCPAPPAECLARPLSEPRLARPKRGHPGAGASGADPWVSEGPCQHGAGHQPTGHPPSPSPGPAERRGQGAGARDPALSSLGREGGAGTPHWPSSGCGQLPPAGPRRGGPRALPSVAWFRKPPGEGSWPRVPTRDVGRPGHLCCSQPPCPSGSGPSS